MSRSDLKALGESDEGPAAVDPGGLYDMQAKIDEAMKHAQKRKPKEIRPIAERRKKDAKTV